MNFSNIIFETSFGTFSQLGCSDVPEICFSGKSNVGKSSIINKTFGRKSLAFVSTKPGKTVTINFYKIDNVRIVDLPGYGYAKINFQDKMRFADLLVGYFKSDRNIAVVFQLIDIRHKATEQDMSMLSFLKEMGVPYVIVLTKSDKLNKSELAARMESIPGELGTLAEDTEIIATSSSNGQGIDRIRQIIEEISNLG